MMRRLLNSIRAGFWICCATSSLLAATELRAASAAAFQPGDRWCAVGDSITHSGRYHDYIYLFYATRFPDRSLEFFNGGIAGDTAAGTLKRLDSDILRHQPTVATILLGMNDVGRHLYADGVATPARRQQREARLSDYRTNLTLVAQTLRKAGTRMIFITPSIFDQTVAPALTNSPGVNDALGECADFVRQLARQFDCPVVDFYGPMVAINRARQQQDPHFTLIGPDRVHPGEVGHLVMAYLFLKAQGVPAFVADITVDAAGTNAIAFTRQEEALPFPVPAACLPALELVPFMEDLNQERLRVTGLAPGSYAVAIDGQTVAQLSADALARGLNLAACTNTPQYQQALRVAGLDEQRFSLVKQLRTLDYVEGMMGRKIGAAGEFDHVAAAGKIKTNHPWIRSQVQDYLRLKPQQAALQGQLAECVRNLRAASRPQPHSFTVKLIPPHS